MVNLGYISRNAVLILGLKVIFSDRLNAQENASLNVFFPSSKSVLLENEKLKVINFLQTQDTSLISSISIYGYCDEIGTKRYNDSLSKERANYIKSFLLEFGIRPSVIAHTEGKGELILDNVERDIVEQRAANRMVEILIKKEKAHKIPPVKKEIKKDSVVKKIQIEIPPKSFNDNLKIGDTLIFENILFMPNSHKFQPLSYPILKALVNDLKRNPQYFISISGHICCLPPNDDGSDAMDVETGILNLSTARAKAVYDYLVKKGIKRERLTYIGLIGKYPRGKGNDRDRRVEMKITDIKY
jgi:outer membrane protein OmpA-like peptidoglycan-associated protein